MQTKIALQHNVSSVSKELFLCNYLPHTACYHLFLTLLTLMFNIWY